MRRRDKSSDHHEIHGDLLNTINERATANELNVITKLTFWEKVGLSKVSSNKKEMMLSKGKQKLDESYSWLRSTIIQSKQLEAELNKKRDHIKGLLNEFEDLESQIAEAK